MKCNVNHLDRAIRLGAGMFLLATPLLDLHTYPVNLFGIVLIGTGLAGFCPLYAAIRALVPKREHGLREAHATVRH